MERTTELLSNYSQNKLQVDIVVRMKLPFEQPINDLRKFLLTGLTAGNRKESGTFHVRNIHIC